MNNFILYGIDPENDIFYISNTNPIIWSTNIDDSKLYYARYPAEYNILRDYDNYRAVSREIESGRLSGFYVAEIDDENNIIEQNRIL